MNFFTMLTNDPVVMFSFGGIYSNHFKLHDSVGIRNVLGKALIVENGYSLIKINNAA